MANNDQGLMRQQLSELFTTLAEGIDKEMDNRVEADETLEKMIVEVKASLGDLIREAVHAALEDPATARALWSQKRKPSVVK